MATIRVDPDKLRAVAIFMAQMQEMAEAMRGDALQLTSGAPSYDGQFGPRVQAIGDEAAVRLRAVAGVLQERHDFLMARADAFEAADQKAVEGMISSAGSIETWLNQQFPSRGRRPRGLARPVPPGPVPPLDVLPAWLVELIVSLFPFGDAVGILRQLANLLGLGSGEFDGLDLLLSAAGLALDFGGGPLGPDDATVAFMKSLAKVLPPGPARKALEELLESALKHPDEWAPLGKTIGELAGRPGLLTKLMNDHPELVVTLLRNGPEAVETIARYGDEGIALVARYQDDMLEFLMRTPDEVGDLALRTTDALEAAERLKEVGLHSDGAADLVERIARDMTHGTGDRVVLGEWVEGGGGYAGEAMEHGGIYYETPEVFYDALGRNKELAWAVNEQFLRNQVQAGVPRIDFVGDVQATFRSLNERHFRWREIDYLLSHGAEQGYELVGNSWVKVR